MKGGKERRRDGEKRRIGGELGTCKKGKTIIYERGIKSSCVCVSFSASKV